MSKKKIQRNIKKRKRKNKEVRSLINVLYSHVHPDWAFRGWMQNPRGIFSSITYISPLELIITIRQGKIHLTLCI